jgi:hypothetical protein
VHDRFLVVILVCSSNESLVPVRVVATLFESDPTPNRFIFSLLQSGEGRYGAFAVLAMATAARG